MVIDANTTDMKGFCDAFWDILRQTIHRSTCKYIIIGFLILTVYYVIFGKGLERKFFGIQGMILVLFIFNPYSMYYISLWFGLSSRYFRYLWITPICLTYGHFLVKVALSGKPGKIRSVLAYVLSFLVLLFGAREVCKNTSLIYTSVETNEGMRKVDNIYKIEQDTLDAVTIIEADKQDPDRMTKVLYGYDIFMDIRTYDASIYCDYGLSMQNKYRYQFISQEMIDELVQPGQEANLLAMMANTSVQAYITYAPYSLTQTSVNVAVKVNNYEYIIVQTSSPYCGMFTECGDVLGETDNFTVIKVNL